MKLSACHIYRFCLQCHACASCDIVDSGVRSTGDLLDYGQDKIDVSGKTTDRQIVCFECCKGNYLDCSPNSMDAEIYIKECNCIDNKPDKKGC